MAALRTLLASLVVLAAGVGVLAGVTDRFRAYTTETARRIGVREHSPLVTPLPLQTEGSLVAILDWTDLAGATRYVTKRMTP